MVRCVLCPTPPVTVPRPTAADLAAARDRTIPDIIAPGLRVLFAGINPGLYSAATGYHFARPGNRFWPALHRSGFTPRQLRPSEQDELLDLGLGITNVAPRATARAAELSAAELRAGPVLTAKVVDSARRGWRCSGSPPTGPRSASRTRSWAAGRLIGPTRLWVLPNPSGLNALWTTPKLTEAFRDLRLRVTAKQPGEQALLSGHVPLR